MIIDLYLICSINKTEFINASCRMNAKKLFRKLYPKEKILISENPDINNIQLRQINYKFIN